MIYGANQRMRRILPRLMTTILWLAGLPGLAQSPTGDLSTRAWYEARTTHFQLYSCGPTREVFRLGGRLEQYCQAYARLAGADAVDSPPIIVLAFPDHASMVPYLPLYEGQPGNMAAFFHHGADENLIVLSLPERGQVDTDLRVIYHEYSHLLFRRNDQIWPLWLKEGMAEIYSTFSANGRNVRIASPILWHLTELHRHPLMSLAELFSVQTDSPQYNESQRQGVFYAESWLLTHYLVAGDNPQYRARFGRFTTLLRAGQEPVAAFTNALQSPLPVIQAGLRAYLARGVFHPVDLALATNLAGPVNIATRRLAPAEIECRLGDELMRINRRQDAAACFNAARRLAPASPLPEEGLGLLASAEHRHDEALRHLQSAVQMGSDNFLVHYTCAYEELRGTAADGEHYRRVDESRAAGIRAKLERAVELMPNFAPAQEFFGFFEMVQGDNLRDAGTFLQRAVELEPQNLSYLFTLAQYQYRTQDPVAARATLQPLLRPGVDAPLRAQAQRLLQEMDAGR